MNEISEYTLLQFGTFTLKVFNLIALAFFIIVIFLANSTPHKTSLKDNTR
jgi:hypothetical protein